MEELLSFVSNIGFPIAISCYILVRHETKLDELRDAILELSRAFEKMNR
ncbi:hypothetical protein ABID14_001196 [Peptoniphilus olsenii]|uniref:YvrJ family protein n=1 Tax=Peptoniphilus olsenii TaxID=411570 RepID=A0ABV2J9V7_9FIRM